MIKLVGLAITTGVATYENLWKSYILWCLYYANLVQLDFGEIPGSHDSICQDIVVS